MDVRRLGVDRHGDKPISVYTLTAESPGGVEAEILDYGCVVKAIRVRKVDGHPVDVVLGYDTLDGYLEDKRYLGSVVGRVANRIKGGELVIDGHRYQLPLNNGPNHLHGGPEGFHRKVWAAEVLGDGVILSYSSPDGECGYPGRVDCRVSYRLIGAELRISYEAVADQPTPVNLTNHSYFNLSGEGSENVYDHDITIPADFFLPTDEACLVTGEVFSVSGKPYDFREGADLGQRLRELAETGKKGFDNHFCLQGSPGSLRRAASLKSRTSGIHMEVTTTQPGIQCYTGNFLDQTGKGGKRYGKHSSLCLETQGFPDAVNKPHFPGLILRPGEKYEHTTVYRFGV